jgi:hypothetical protein
MSLEVASDYWLYKSSAIGMHEDYPGARYAATTDQEPGLSVRGSSGIAAMVIDVQVERSN